MPLTNHTHAPSLHDGEVEFAAFLADFRSSLRSKMNHESARDPLIKYAPLIKLLDVRDRTFRLKRACLAERYLIALAGFVRKQIIAQRELMQDDLTDLLPALVIAVTLICCVAEIQGLICCFALCIRTKRGASAVFDRMAPIVRKPAAVLEFRLPSSA